MQEDEGAGCGILFHQRPMLQDMTDVADPLGALFFMSWVLTREEELTDESLAQATMPLNGQNLIFLKAIVDGTPEIINIELPEGQFVRARDICGAEPVICVHYTNDPASGFYCRRVESLKIVAPIRGWNVRRSNDSDEEATP